MKSERPSRPKSVPPPVNPYNLRSWRNSGGESSQVNRMQSSEEGRAAVNARGESSQVQTPPVAGQLSIGSGVASPQLNSSAQSPEELNITHLVSPLKLRTPNSEHSYTLPSSWLPIMVTEPAPPLMEPALETMESLDRCLAGRVINDPATIGDVGQLRDRTSAALTDVLTHARSGINELRRGNGATYDDLETQFQNSLHELESKIDELPRISVFSPGSAPRIETFDGSEEGAIHFPLWLRRIEDIIKIQEISKKMSSEHKASFLIGFLEGMAREKVQELDPERRSHYDSVVEHLRRHYESSQNAGVSLEKLRACQQGPTESAAVFGNRILGLVRSAMAGEDDNYVRRRLLEEFVNRLRPNIRYYVKLDKPRSFDEALSKAQEVQQLLNEATSASLINPAGADALTVCTLRQAADASTSRYRSTSPPAQRVSSFRQRDSRSRGGPSRPRDNRPAPRQQPRQFSPQPRFRDSRGWNRSQSGSQQEFSPPQACWYCGIAGHILKECRKRMRDLRQGQQGQRVQWQQPEVQQPNYDGPSHPPQQQRQPFPRVQAVTTQEEVKEAENEELVRTRNRLAVAERQLEALKIRQDSQRRHIENNGGRRSPFGAAATLMVLTMASMINQGESLQVNPFNATVPLSSFPLKPFLCNKEARPEYFRLPKPDNCSAMTKTVEEEPYAQSLRIFRPNTLVYTSEASVCRISTQIVTYNVGFFGARQQREDRNDKIVTAEECKMMATRKRCEHGELSNIGGTWKTSNKIVIDWPWGPKGYFSGDMTQEVTNCAYFSATISKRHHKKTPESAVDDMRVCDYQEGFCSLSDGAAMIWTPQKQEQCDYVEMGRFSGSRSDDIWLSDDHTIALAWHENGTTVTDCGMELLPTEMGYAIPAHIRKRRSPPAVGIVMTPQLSTQLSAVSEHTHRTTMAMYSATIRAICERGTSAHATMMTAASLSPVSVARFLLNRTDITAAYAGNGILAVRQCVEIPSAKLLSFEGRCFDKPLVEIAGPNGTLAEAFVDPKTMEVSENATEIRCVAGLEFYLAGHRFDPVSGQLEAVSEDEITNLGHGIVGDLLPPQRTVFHNWVLTPLGELDSPVNFVEIFRSHAAKFETQGHGTFTSAGKGSSFRQTVAEVTSSWSLINVSGLDVLNIICDAVVVLWVLKTCFVLYLRYKMAGFAGLTDRNWLREAQPVPQPPQFNFAPPPALLLPTRRGGPTIVEIENIPMRAVQRSREPRAEYHREGTPHVVFPSIAVLSCLPRSDFFVAQIPIRANGIEMYALVDTGAAATIASNTTAAVIGADPLLPSQYPAAVGMGNVPVKLIGKSDVRLNIAGFDVKTTVHFTEGHCGPTGADLYEIILGNDTLAQLPAWGIDYRNKTFRVGPVALPVGEKSLPVNTSLLSPEKPRKIRVATQTVVKQGTEAFVPCTIENGAGHSMFVTAERVPNIDRQLVWVSPAVFKTDAPKLLVSNPGDEAVTLYKGQTITWGYPVLEDEEGATMARRAKTPGSGVIVGTAVTNVAIYSMTTALSELELAADIPIVRFVADRARKLVPSHPYDLPAVVERLKDHPEVQANKEWSKAVTKFLEGRKHIDDYDTSPEAADNATIAEREQFAIAEEHASELLNKVFAIVLRVYKPKIILATVASLDRLLGPQGLLSQGLDFDLVMWDEASQIPEFVFPQIAAKMRSARHAFFGDTKQMPPFCPMDKSTFPARVGARALLATARLSTRVVQWALLGGYRCPMAVIGLANAATYHGAFTRAPGAPERTLVRRTMPFMPNPDMPIAFIDLSSVGEQCRGAKGSYSNTKELQAVKELLQKIYRCGITEEQVVVLSYYKDQVDLFKKELAGVEVDQVKKIPKGLMAATIDSIQGQQKDIVILATTRSAANAATERRRATNWNLSFVDDNARTNVAITRTKEGLFILGEAKLLRSDENNRATWEAIIGYVQQHHLWAPPGFIPLTKAKYQA